MWRALFAIGLVLATLGNGAHAQPYPARTVRVIVPFAAGGTPDVVGRVVAQQLSAQTGQSWAKPSQMRSACGMFFAQRWPDKCSLLARNESSRPTAKIISTLRKFSSRCD